MAKSGNKKYWSRMLFPPPGDLPDPGIKPMSLVAPALQADSLPLSHHRSPKIRQPGHKKENYTGQYH